MRRLSRRSDLTFKANLQNGRHGWLRLTPAYAATLVEDLLQDVAIQSVVLDPFAGTGTTGLVCAEKGLQCDMVEINPFLAWLASVKVCCYTASEAKRTLHLAQEVLALCEGDSPLLPQRVPPMRNIERWWTPPRLVTLSRLYEAIHTVCQSEPTKITDLLLVAFCQVLIRWSNAGYHHPSVTFRVIEPSLFPHEEASLILTDFINSVSNICASAVKPLRGKVEVFTDDARTLGCLEGRTYDMVITSPPYPNRISYVREVRPFLYWLGFLKTPREAGELDWQAIGGTWGAATSRLLDIELNNNELYAMLPELQIIVGTIDRRSPLLSRYVVRYFQDMYTHLQHLSRLLKKGACIRYIVGNAKFYDVIVPTEQLLAHLMQEVGIEQLRIEPLRKRNSKKELVEFLISGIKL
ncbi:hypothetical protein HRbin15_01465 [bacterium HR15]|nr:hypothetical protein HRbin15_01465 [bacterium HR15]